MWLRFLVGVSLLLVSHAPLVLAEQFRVGPVYRGQPGEVSVVIELPPGVTPAASGFRLLVDGNLMATAREIKPFRNSGQGLALAVCVDVSGTMAHGPLNDIKEALLTFLGRVRAEDRIALITFADKGEVASSFGETRDHLIDAVRNLDLNLKGRGNKTRLYQTVYEYLERLQDPKLPKRLRMLVISDGKDEGSTESAASVSVKSKTLNIPIDTVGYGRIERQYMESLRGLSDSTGGYFVYASPDRLSLIDALNQIYENLLETRSLVAYFMYQADDAKPKTQNAWLELQRPGLSPWRGEIPEAIPRVLVPAPKPWWPWLILVVLLGVGLVVLIRSTIGTKKPAPQQPGIKSQPIIPSEPPLQPVISPESHLAIAPELPHRTQVGGYYFPVPAPGQPTAILTGVDGPVKGQQFSVEHGLFHIGANPENDLQIVDDEYVSGSHAYLRYERDSLFIFDQASRNGTFVNEHEVDATGFALSLGDQIRVGMSTFELGIAPS